MQPRDAHVTRASFTGKYIVCYLYIVVYLALLTFSGMAICLVSQLFLYLRRAVDHVCGIWLPAILWKAYFQEREVAI